MRAFIIGVLTVIMLLVASACSITPSNNGIKDESNNIVDSISSSAETANHPEEDTDHGKVVITMENLEVDKDIPGDLLDVIMDHLHAIKDNDEEAVLNTLYFELQDKANALWLWESRDEIKKFRKIEVETDRKFDIVTVREIIRNITHHSSRSLI